MNKTIISLGLAASVFSLSAVAAPQVLNIPVNKLALNTDNTVNLTVAVSNNSLPSASGSPVIMAASGQNLDISHLPQQVKRGPNQSGSLVVDLSKPVSSGIQEVSYLQDGISGCEFLFNITDGAGGGKNLQVLPIPTGGVSADHCVATYQGDLLALTVANN